MFDQHRNAASLPVVREFRFPREKTREVNGGFGKKNEPFSIVRKIRTTGLVKIRAMIIVRFFN